MRATLHCVQDNTSLVGRAKAAKNLDHFLRGSELM